LQRIREFRESRLAQIRSGQLPVNLVTETLMAVYFVPLSAFDLVQAFSLTGMERHCGHFGPLGRYTQVAAPQEHVKLLRRPFFGAALEHGWLHFPAGFALGPCIFRNRLASQR
jgi:hypothetical protein